MECGLTSSFKLEGISTSLLVDRRMSESSHAEQCSNSSQKTLSGFSYSENSRFVSGRKISSKNVAREIANRKSGRKKIIKTAQEIEAERVVEEERAFKKSFELREAELKNEGKLLRRSLLVGRQDGEFRDPLCLSHPIMPEVMKSMLRHPQWPGVVTDDEKLKIREKNVKCLLEKDYFHKNQWSLDKLVCFRRAILLEDAKSAAAISKMSISSVREWIRFLANHGPIWV